MSQIEIIVDSIKELIIAGAPPTRFACGRDKQVSRSSKCPSEILYAKTLPNNSFANLGVKTL